MFENYLAEVPKNAKKVKVGIDFDSTITADVDTWVCLIRVMQLAGWEPVITTWRPSSAHEEVDEFQALLAIPIPVVYCNGCAKRECFTADIWIDDTPASVIYSLGRAPSFNKRTGDEELFLSGNPSKTATWKELETLKHE